MQLPFFSPGDKQTFNERAPVQKYQVGTFAPYRFYRPF